MEDCPRCGPTHSLHLYGSFKICTRCNQFRVDFTQHVSDEELIDTTFSAPYTYHRSLVRVPGVAHPVATIQSMTQTVQHKLLKNFDPRDSDVWICTYPKSGTTWMQNVVSYLLYNEGSSGKGGGVCVGLTEQENVWWMEALYSTKKEQGTEDQFMDRINAEPTSRPRCFKSHSSLGVLEPLVTAKGKVIHIARNPKDVAVSMWHHARSKNFGYEGPFEHFLEKMFMPGHVESGSWWDFVLPYCHASARSAAHPEPTSPFTKVHTIWYEKMMDDAAGSVMEIATFLEVPITTERAEHIANLCSFSAMKEAEKQEGTKLFSRKLVADSHDGSRTKASSSHIRKGGSGHWQEYLTVAQNKRFDQHHAAKCALPMYRGTHLNIDWGE